MKQIVSNVRQHRFGSVKLQAAGLTLGLGSLLSTPILLAGSATALAQNTNATIRGQVLDPAGALVPNATVVIVEKNTGVTAFRGPTDSAGVFVAPQVIPGTYTITVTATGLKAAVIDNLIASVAQVANVDVNMQIGATSEVVTVQAKGEQLATSTSDISTAISPEDVQNIPVVGRTVEYLFALVPGVTHGGSGDTPSTSAISFNGSRSLNSEILLNGVSMIVASTGAPVALPSPDGIDQVRIFTSNAPAEYGRTSGGVVTANSISGTNVYHGNAYFLIQNEALNANSYFNKLTLVNGAVIPRARDRFFQAGGSLGGPVWIPHLYDGHNKTFFFVNYDRTISNAPTLLSLTVPTAAQRTGDLSNALATTDALGRARTAQRIFQPTGVNSPAFTNNQISPIDPAAARILALLPLPNTPGTYDATNNRYTGNWTSQQAPVNDTLRLVARLNQQMTTADRISLNLYRYNSSAPNPVYYNNPLLNSTFDCTCSNAWLPSIDYTRVWSPSLVMDLNLGYFRNVVIRNPPGAGLNAKQQTGIASLPLDQMPELTSPGFSNIGSDTNTDQLNTTNTFTPFGSVTKTVGPHTLKFGASLRKNQFNSFNPSGNPEGTLAFSGTLTNHGTTGNANTGLADFLLGKITTGNYQLPMPETGRRNYSLGVFAQDDWRATPRLTINAGLRYEYESPMTVSKNIYTRFDPNSGQLLAAGLNASNSLNINTPKIDISPRFGLAFSVDDKTVIRAAFGTFYGTVFQNLGGQVAFPGYDVVDSYNSLGTAVGQPFSLSQGFPLNATRDLKNPFAALVGASASNPFTISGVSFNQLNHLSLVQQWNLGVQRRLPLSLILEVNYVGNHALHLPYVIPVNIVPFGLSDAVTQTNTTTATQNAKPFPTLGSFTVTNDVGNSNYNGLQVTLRRQFNTQLAILSNYTFAKSLDDGSSIFANGVPNGTANPQYIADPALRRQDYAVSNFDTKHTLNIAVVYTTPGPKWLHNIVISPIFYGHTGLPLNITQTNEVPNASQQRPNGDSSRLKLAHTTLNGSALQYLDNPSIDKTAFPLTPTGPIYSTINGVRTRIVETGLGNVPRDSIRAPGEVEFDASVSRSFTVYKAVKFQFRVDAFNVLNHTNLSPPSTSLTVTAVGTAASFVNSSTFGEITAARPTRRLQALARFTF
ncbi:TonB-dependent receptor [Granulicella tundricola]|uniref:TonB-dependent receptor plug n=1 Tax=Granulicella tundricola (strain ATCC BAA-1859 / DSM 23138 / MP5ACTX9) TaxID=1198114 RepID=E8X6C5_GRATM|nr:carboxypeptidase regulatory-like domain-containing protein [Granulicella tundricola]ADW71009.1 TonB-dependent receptor plug [Granulicella tundricola MP5ACTX9]